MSRDCRIIILNFNGRDLLAKCLPSIVDAAAKSPYPCAVTVLDNCSVDDSAAWVKTNFPTVEFVVTPANRILFSYNAYVESVSEEFVILLNNDIRVTEGFVAPLIEALIDHPDALFAASKSLDFDGHYEGSLSKMEMRRGLLWGATRFEGHEIKIDKPGITMQCGFGAFRRRFFMELKGYDDLYFPGTVEDSDICFRGWRRGWKGRYCPDSVVYHMGQASFKKAFGNSGLRRINRRNLYLFVWKNIRDSRMLAFHCLMLPLEIVKYALFGQIDFLLGFFDAAAKLPEALKRRRAGKNETVVVPDRRIFEISSSI